MTPKLLLLGPAILFLCFIFSLSPLTAEDTLGSLVPDTPITLLDGSTVAVQDLTLGTEIWTWMPSEKPAEGKVSGIRRVHSDTYIEMVAGDHLVDATGSHRIALTGAKMVRFNTLKVGDKVLLWTPKGFAEVAVKSLRTLPVTLITYDLTIEGHRMFLVDGIVVGD